MDHGQTVEDASAPSPRPRAVHAFEAVYVDGYGDLVRLATVLTSSRARAEELVQDAYVTAFMKWSKIATYEEPRLWLRRVVINRAFSHRRRIQAELRGLVRLGGTAARESSSDPGHEALASADPVWQEVARLPRRQAQVLVLVALEGCSVADAAEVLGIGFETAKTHLARARATISGRFDTAADLRAVSEDPPHPMPNAALDTLES